MGRDKNDSIRDEQSSSQQPRSSLVGFDNLLEDVFGLNIRSLRSIGALTVRPLEYFRAAKDANWLWRYTPSFRLWFGISAITAALRFVWAAPESSSASVYRLAVDQIVDGANASLASSERMIVLTDAMRDAAAAEMLKWMVVFAPFVTGFLIALLAIVYRAWGERLTYVVRLRYLFSTLITGSFLGFVSAFLMMLIPENIYQQINFILLLMIFCAYFYTAFRGPYRAYDLGARIGLSTALTLILAIIVMAGVFISMTIGIWMVVTNTFPTPVSVTGN